MLTEHDLHAVAPALHRRPVAIAKREAIVRLVVWRLRRQHCRRQQLVHAFQRRRIVAGEYLNHRTAIIHNINRFDDGRRCVQTTNNNVFIETLNFET